MYKSIKKKPTYLIIIILLLIVPATIWTVDKTHTLYGTANFTNDTINFTNGTYITAMTTSQLQNIGVAADPTAECDPVPGATGGEVFLYSNAKIILQDGSDVGGSIGPLVDFYDFIFIGSIGMFASGAGAAGWLPCDGTEYEINDTTNCQYQKLANRIQDMWGGTGAVVTSDNDGTVGNYKGTFRVPDLRGRFLRGANEMASTPYFRYKEGDPVTDPEMSRGDYDVAGSYATQGETPTLVDTATADAITPVQGNTFHVYLDDPANVGQVLQNGDTSIRYPLGGTFPVGLGYQRSNIPVHDHSLTLDSNVVMNSPPTTHQHAFLNENTATGQNLLFDGLTQTWDSDNQNRNKDDDAQSSEPGQASVHFAQALTSLDTSSATTGEHANKNKDIHQHVAPFPDSFQLLERTDSGPLDMRPQNVNIGFYIRY